MSSDTVEPTRNRRWIYAGGSLIVIVIILLVAWYNFFPDKEDLSRWENQDSRVSLLPYLLKEDFTSHVERKPVQQSSPIYSLSISEVISILGKPDESYSDELIYDIGNIDAGAFGNFIVPQNAILQLFFVDDKCIEYAIIT